MPWEFLCHREICDFCDGDFFTGKNIRFFIGMTKIVTNIIWGQNFQGYFLVSWLLYSTFFKSVTSTQKSVTEKNTAHSTTLHDTTPQQSHDTTPDHHTNTTPATPTQIIPFHDTTRYYTTPQNTTAPHRTTLHPR